MESEVRPKSSAKTVKINMVPAIKHSATSKVTNNEETIDEDRNYQMNESIELLKHKF
jgi:hypothetical protein